MLNSFLVWMRNLSLPKKIILLPLLALFGGAAALGIIGGVIEGITGYKIVDVNNNYNTSRTPTNSLTPTPTPSLTGEALEKSIIEEAAKTAAGYKFREVEINKDMGSNSSGGYIVIVHVNGKEGFTDESTKSAIKQQISEIYVGLYEKDLKVDEAVVTVHMPLIDKYGNTKDGIVYKTLLDRATASKVNWQADRAMLLIEILPKLWELHVANVSLRD